VKETSASADLFENTTPAKTGFRKWILPVIFLVLVPILVAAAAFSSQAPNISGVTNVALFVLTALLCTLVAVALTLTGCGEWLTRIEQSIQVMAAQFVGLQDTQAHLQEALQKSTGQSDTKTLQEEGNRRLVQEGVTQLAGGVQTVVSNMTALSTALQAHREATQTALAALTDGQGQLTGEVRQLRELTQTVTGGLTQAAREQAVVRGLAQDHAQALTAATEAIQQSQGTLHAKLEDVARAGRQIIEAVAGGIAGAAQEQATVRGLLQDNARAVTAVTEAIQQSQGTLHAKLEDVARAGRQIAETATAMATEQRTAQETMKRMVEDVTGTGANHVPLGEALRAHGDVINVAVAALAASEGRLTEDVRQLHEMTQTLAGGMTDAVREQAAAHNSLQQVLTGTTELIHQGQSTVQTKLEDIAGTGKQTIEAVTAVAAEQKTGQETARRTLEEVTGLGTRQAAIAETLQTHRDAVNTGIATLTGGQGQLTADVRQLRELTQTLAGGVADANREQAAAHGALQQALNGTTEVIHQRHNAVQAKLEEMAGTGRQTIEAVTTIAAGQTALHETTRHVMAEVTGVAARQTTLGEALQAHRDVTDTGIVGLTTGQGQLTGDVRQLHELTQTVAGGVTDAIREQAATHGTLQDKARALTEATDAIQQSQQALRIELEKLAQSATQTIEAVNAVAVGQTTGREATRHMIGELANVAIAALSTGHGPLPHLDRPLDVVARAVAGSGPLNIELPSPAAETAPAPKLAAAQAIIHGEQMKYEAGQDRDNLGYWANPSDWAEWELDVARPGRFKVTAEIAAVASGRFQVLLGDQGLDGNAPSTGDYGRFQKVEIGTVEVPTAGKTSLAVRPVPEGWQPMNLRSVELVPLA
jgi:uncharacterized phage infection (PIP) family protein YhgE